MIHDCSSFGFGAIQKQNSSGFKKSLGMFQIPESLLFILSKMYTKLFKLGVKIFVSSQKFIDFYQYYGRKENRKVKKIKL